MSFVNILLISLAWLGFIKGLDYGCKCGRAHKGEMKAFRYLNLDTDFRIVNGFEPNRRPWMALIQLHPKSGSISLSESQQCGGAVVNKEWVVTAAHCFCMGGLKCTKTAPSKLEYGLERVSVHVGQHNMEELNMNKELKHSVKKVILHPKYIRKKRDMNDLALIKVEGTIVFNKFVAPICLPDSEKFKDDEIEVYVSGWGTLNDKNCLTEKGPSPNAECSLPFIYNGNTIKSCLFQGTPSSKNPVCKKFARSNPDHWQKHPKGQIHIVGKDGVKTTCYDENPGENGWCGACNKKAKPGKPGFCRKRKNGRRKKRTFAIPTEDKDWGWCQKQCLTKKGERTAVLQEVQLTTLNDTLCKEMGKAMKSVPKIELCGASKRKVPMPVVYRQMDTGGFEKDASSEKGEQKEEWGGKDSCKGDSGGPMFTWQDGRAVLVGIVSRGKGCAAVNQAGIYSRITSHLKWIEENIDSGKC